MNIGFLSDRIGLRGTEVAMFDYAKYNEELLGNNSFIATLDNPLDITAVKKFKDRFGNIEIIRRSNNKDYDKFVEKNKIDILYKIAFGVPEYTPINCKTVVHTVFNVFQPFGNVYSYVSEYIRNKAVPQSLWSEFPFVPHIIDLPDINDDMREELGIPKSAIVFGYHGGSDSFNIDFVKRCIIQNIDKRKDIYFLFMNIDQFYSHERIIYLKGNSDLIYKTKFINSCNAMLHARNIGETFGIACGEFSIRNKPVIAYSHVPDINHLNILGDKAIIYQNDYVLSDILLDLESYLTYDDWNCYRDFNPEKVMNRFKEVYINENFTV